MFRYANPRSPETQRTADNAAQRIAARNAALTQALATAKAKLLECLSESKLQTQLLADLETIITSSSSEADKAVALRHFLRSKIIEKEQPTTKMLCDEAFKLQLQLTEYWPVNEIDDDGYPICPLILERLDEPSSYVTCSSGHIFNKAALINYYKFDGSHKFNPQGNIQLRFPVATTSWLSERDIAHFRKSNITLPQQSELDELKSYVRNVRQPSSNPSRRGSIAVGFRAIGRVAGICLGLFIMWQFGIGALGYSFIFAFGNNFVGDLAFTIAVGCGVGKGVAYVASYFSALYFQAADKQTLAQIRKEIRRNNGRNNSELLNRARLAAAAATNRQNSLNQDRNFLNILMIALSAYASILYSAYLIALLNYAAFQVLTAWSEAAFLSYSASLITALANIVTLYSTLGFVATVVMVGLIVSMVEFWKPGTIDKTPHALFHLITDLIKGVISACSFLGSQVGLAIGLVVEAGIKVITGLKPLITRRDLSVIPTNDAVAAPSLTVNAQMQQRVGVRTDANVANPVPYAPQVSRADYLTAEQEALYILRLQNEALSGTFTASAPRP